MGPQGDGGVCTPVVQCEMCDQSGFVPSTMGTPTVTAGACTKAQESAFATACFGSLGGTQASCTAWGAMDSGACSACLGGSQDTSATWGALHIKGMSEFLNIGGCIDRVLTMTGSEKVTGGMGSCGDALTSWFGCEDAACGTCTASSDYTNCTNDVDNGSCAPVRNHRQRPRLHGDRG